MVSPRRSSPCWRGSRGSKVIARTSSFAFRRKEQDVRKIADTLNVTHILEGSVRRSGSRIRVTTQLIDAADGSHLWSERYDRELSGIFAVQDVRYSGSNLQRPCE